MASEIQKLDREKDFLLKEASTCSGAVRELDRKLEHLRQRRDEKIRAMAQASAMFLHGKEKERAELVMKDSKGRDIKKVVVVQPMGRRDAVAQTRRRIAKQADQLRKERSAIEARYNRMKMRIMKLKQSIDGARREGIIFDKTFASVHEDLLQVKRDISQQKREIQYCYGMRDVARQEGRASIDRMKADRVHALMQFEMDDKVIQEANALGVSRSTGDEGQLSKQQEDMLRKRIKDSMSKAHTETARIHRMKLKQAALEEAIDAVLDHTGCGSVDEVVRQLNAFEEDKFKRAAAVSRTMEDLEQVERELSALRDEYSEKQSQRDEVVLGKAKLMEDASAEMEYVQHQLRTQEATKQSLKQHLNATWIHIQKLFDEAAADAAAGAHAKVSAERSVDSMPSPSAPNRAQAIKRRNSIATAHHLMEGVSVASLPSYLQAIEDGVNDLIQKYAVATADSGAQASLQGSGQHAFTPIPGDTAGLTQPSSQPVLKPTVSLGPS